MRSIKILIILCAIVFYSLPAHAQISRIEGYIIDTDSMHVPAIHAAVFIKNDNDSIISSTLTDSNGYYISSSLAAGKYIVEIQYQKKKMIVCDARVSKDIPTVVIATLNVIKKLHGKSFFENRHLILPTITAAPKEDRLICIAHLAKAVYVNDPSPGWLGMKHPGSFYTTTGEQIMHR